MEDVFNTLPTLLAKNWFEYSRISKIVLSKDKIVSSLAPLILYEDNHLLVIFKPPGILSQKDKTHDLSVNEIFAAYLKEKYQKPGNVFCAAVHRLDRPASGLMVLARTSKAAARVSEEIRLQKFEKKYRVLTSTKLPGKGRTILTGAMEKQGYEGTFKAIQSSAPNSSLYVLTARLVAATDGIFDYEVSIETGKFHQIRTLFAAYGAPILGDTKYGGIRLKAHKECIALVSAGLKFTHPTQKKPCVFYLSDDFLRQFKLYFV
ncbi:MAG: hypothetical protein LDLANPLL_01311 [Turneriella sp.]|nr:hypothetical protein [Turneriella sp.]